MKCSSLFLRRGARMLAFAAVAFVSARAAATLSGAVRMIPTTSGSLLWRTCMAEGIAWEWPEGAASAKLTVSGKGGTAEHLFNRPAASSRPVPETTFALVPPTDASAEDVLDLSLAFYSESDATGEVLADETLSAEGVGLVRGVNGAALDLRPVAETSRAWRSVGGTSAVLPIPEETTSLSLDGVACEWAAAPGWHLWNGIAGGRDYAWSLTADEMDFAALLRLSPSGFTFNIR